MNKTEMIERNNKISNKADAHRKEQGEIRSEMALAIHEMVAEMGGKVEVDYDCDDPISISYDGGRHPEYASNLYADVYSVKAAMVKGWESRKEKKSFSVEIEETDDYSENRMNYDDVEQVFDFVCGKYEEWLEDMEELTNEFVQICAEKKLKTYKQVRKTIFDKICKDYKNKGVQKCRVEAVSDYLAESVVLRMEIPHEA